MRERLYYALAKLFGAVETWFRHRADGFHYQRMMLLYSQGTRVRLLCNAAHCPSPDEHEGHWLVFSYDVDADDFQLVRKLPLPPPASSGLPSGRYVYVKPHQIEAIK